MQRIQVLKYLVLTTMLMGSDINPFDSQETKPYKNDPRIAAMTELVDAYQRDDIDQYSSVLQKNNDLLADPFIAENIDEVTRSMRTKAVLKLVAPYTRFRLDFIAKRLAISIPEVQDIIGFLILDQKLFGKINQDAGTVEIEDRVGLERMRAVSQWTGAIRSLAAMVLDESDGFKVDDAAMGGGGMGADFGDLPTPSWTKGPAASQQGGRRRGKGGYGRA
jgi:COP9 signalosome complex subunit 2